MNKAYAPNPSEVARETLRQLALLRRPPTPDNFRELYNKIAGTAPRESFPTPALRALVNALPRGTPDQAKLARALDGALGKESWPALTEALSEFIERAGAEPPNWANLIRNLMLQFQAQHAGFTQARKREALDTVLAAAPAPDILFGRLQSVVRSWGQGSIDNAEHAPVTAPAGGSESTAALDEIKALVADLLDNVLSLVAGGDEALLSEAQQLSVAIKAAQGPLELRRAAERLKKFGYRLHFVAEDTQELRAALEHLIQLIIDNISELVIDDQWLSGQIGVVRELMSEPLTLRRLDDVERRLKDVIFKQSALKHSLNEAKDRLKEMLATFVDRLAAFSQSTSGYHDTIERCATRISQANDIGELASVLDEVMRETRTIQLDALRSRDDMNHMRQRVAEAESEIDRLQAELAQASDMVRSDPLTGALNRKGMNEAMEREAARAQRQRTPLCMALLDIDNFKKLNDGMGHAAGDAALVHLAQVVQETIRPQDTLARYGGEEFVVLLPATPVDDAVNAMTRVQRELTRRFFLHNNEKVLITFSCGVSEMGDQEDPFEALKRADNAMYLAKRAGKNRVIAA